MSAPPGWYDDPTSSEHLRYWNGSAWTEYRSPRPAAWGGTPTGFPVLSRPRHVFTAPRSRPPFPTLPFAAALVGLASVALPVVAVKWLATTQWWGQQFGPMARLLIVMVAAYGLVIPAWLAVARRTRYSASESIGLMARREDWWKGPMTTAVCFAVAVLVAVGVVMFKLPIERRVGDRSVVRFDPTMRVLTVLLAVVVAPIFEEIAFRGLVLRGLLRRFSPVWAIFLQALLFGALHWEPALGATNWARLAILSGVGATLGAVAYETRRLVPTIIGHALYNTVIVVIALANS